MSRLSWMILTIFFLSACATEPKHITSTDWNVATQQVVHQYAEKEKTDLLPDFQKAKVKYPPKKIALLAFKKEMKVELWARQDHQWHYIKSLPIRAASGRPGPKLQEDDEQIPEGIYKITFLHPFSQLHLSMKLNYPNDFDKAHAYLDGRSRLGNDIFIHGKNLSVGCIALGDKAIEDLFVLVNDVGLVNTKVIIAPNDLRKHTPITQLSETRPWVPELYQQLSEALKGFTA